MTLKLINPQPGYEESYHRYISELGDEERYPFPLDFDYSNFPLLLRRLGDFSQGKNIPGGFVPATTYWLVEEGEIVGVSNLRHYLNERIRHSGGHIGLGIRPGYRGKRLSIKLLELTLEKASERGIDPIHIHCHKSNEASSRMIQAVGGKLDSEIVEENSTEVVLRYILEAST